MNNQSLPTDKLYKTLAIGGIVFSLFMGYLMWTRANDYDVFLKEHINDYSKLVDKKFILKSQIEKQRIEYTIKNDKLISLYDIDFEEIRKDSTCIKSLFLKIKNNPNFENQVNALLEINKSYFLVDSLRANLRFINNLSAAGQDIDRLFTPDLIFDIVLVIFLVAGLMFSIIGFTIWFKKEKLKIS